MSEILLHVSAGQGPAECRHVVARLAAAFAKEAAADGLACAPLEPVTGEPPSMLLAVSGAGAEAFARARTGTIRWIGASPFRPNHRRRNWFVGVAVVPGVDAVADLREADIAYQTMRASGPGGQHVNTTDSAVRATHVPTGLVAVSREQRSQHANKRVARAKLALMMAERRDAALGAGERAAWERNQALERGGAVRTYEGEGFRVR